MRHIKTGLLCLLGAATLTACGNSVKEDAEVARALKDLNVIDESNLGDLVLNSADPNEAVAYFQKSSLQSPDRIDLQRGHGKSLIRAGRATEATVVWAKVAAHEEATDADRVDFADALIRNGDWGQAETVLDSVPPTFETYNRYRLEAVVADSNKEWKKADSFYETAIGLTTTPGSVLNNWGYSKLTRGEYADAEKKFTEAIVHNPSMFTAKNNLVLARAQQKKYNLPLLQMTQTERAQLMYTMALAAVKQGDTQVGKNLLQDAIDTHPQHFDAAVRSLATLEG